MVTDVFHDERQDVFWIVGMGTDRRHAMTMRPGAVYAGQSVVALCGTTLKIPQPTPSGRPPRSKHVTEKCVECEEQSNADWFSHALWDF